MDIRTTHIGSYAGKPANIIELEITAWSGQISEDIVEGTGYVNEGFIQSLKDLVEELEDHNNEVTKNKNDLV